MKVGQKRIKLFIKGVQSTIMLGSIIDGCRRDDHKLYVSTNAATHTILSLFLSSTRRVVWSSGSCNAIFHFEK